MVALERGNSGRPSTAGGCVTAAAAERTSTTGAPATPSSGDAPAGLRTLVSDVATPRTPGEHTRPTRGGGRGLPSRPQDAQFTSDEERAGRGRYKGVRHGCSRDDRENEADIIIPAEAITVPLMAMMIRHCSGIVCLCLSGERLDTHPGSPPPYTDPAGAPSPLDRL